MRQARGTAEIFAKGDARTFNFFLLIKNLLFTRLEDENFTIIGRCLFTVKEPRLWAQEIASSVKGARSGIPQNIRLSRRERSSSSPRADVWPLQKHDLLRTACHEWDSVF